MSTGLEEAQARDRQNRDKVTRESAAFMTKLANRLACSTNVRIESSRDWLSVRRLRGNTCVTVSTSWEHHTGPSQWTVTGRFSVRAHGKLWRARAVWDATLIGEIAAYVLHALEQAQAEATSVRRTELAVRQTEKAIAAAGLDKGPVHVTAWSDRPYTTMRVEVSLPALTVEQALEIARFAQTVLERKA